MSDKNDGGPTPLDLESLRGPMLATLDLEIEAFRGTKVLIDFGLPGRSEAYAKHLSDLTELRTQIISILAELTARRAREEAVEAIAAADNTLHSAVDHWQERARRAEAALRARDAEVEALVAAASDFAATMEHSIAASNFGAEMQGKDTPVPDSHPVRSAIARLDAALRPFHPSGSVAEGETP